MRKLYFLIGLLLLASNILAQESPEQEMRAVWLTSVYNNDWPKKTFFSDSKTQKAKLVEMMDGFAEIGLNAVFFQVRPACDALYKSNIEPWSRYASGTEGKDPGYDPLQWVIEEAHKRGIEVHAWMNPYRAAVPSRAPFNPEDFDENHIYRKHPEWTIEGKYWKQELGGYQYQLILNPGLPEVADYVAEVAADMVENYDVDGVHFDDYFYSYDGTRDEQDQEAFDTYAEEGMSRGDFRRASINDMVRKVNEAVKAKKPYLEFGVSPFGIWTMDQQVAEEYGVTLPDKSDVYGMDAYHQIYCDPLAWMRDGTVDYVTPQQYWTTGSGQDYLILNNWWAAVAKKYNSRVYTGQAIHYLGTNPAARKTVDSQEVVLHEDKYYMNTMGQVSNQRAAATATGWSLSEIKKQVEINRSNADKGVKGNVFFSASFFWKVNGLYEYIRDNVYNEGAIVPARLNADTVFSAAVPQQIRFEQEEGGLTTLKWDYEKGDSVRYLILESESQEQDPAIRTDFRIVSYKDEYTTNVPMNDSDALFYSIWAYDRYGNVQPSSTWQHLEKPGSVVPITEEGSLNRDEAQLQWTHGTMAMGYALEVSTDKEMQELSIAVDTLTDTTFSVTHLQAETDYYWRVRSHNMVGYSTYSPVQTFRLDGLKDPNLISPSNDERGVNPQLTLKWNASEISEQLVVQVKESKDTFESSALLIADTVTASLETYTFSNELEVLAYYDVRIKSISGDKDSRWITHRFRTSKEWPAIPTLITSVMEERKEDNALYIAWEQAPFTEKYHIQVATDTAFETMVAEETIIGQANTSYTLNNLSPVTVYHIRVAAVSSEGNTKGWSTIYSIETNELVSGIEVTAQYQMELYPVPAQEEVTLRWYLQGQLASAWYIRDLAGKVISSGLLPKGKNTHTIPVKGLSKGIYLLEIRTTDHHKITRKLFLDNQ
ncbi:family 10 glycosylhydrolase [Algivirga pacifica]|uniref:Fibronectin type-III domain-containing protein n=1 Tax=Algivirga pacifica TaxID=1162670 RepID=A0ABP9DD93_9BACT